MTEEMTVAMDEERRVVWFEDVGKEDISRVGAKGANLGEMTKAHIPVPPGFIGTAQSYFYFLEKSNLSGEIRSLLSSLAMIAGSCKGLPQRSRRQLVVLLCPILSFG
ncbi:MAG: PEP/pyruvate-binding domain-containing protein [Dehalococcoidia bacterium]